MNLREGMRRIGMVLGVAGAIIGGVAGYASASTTWQSRASARQFQYLRSCPTVEKFLKKLLDPFAQKYQ